MKSEDVTIEVQYLGAVDIDCVDLGGKRAFRCSRDKDAWAHDEWRVTLTYQGRSHTTSYKTGIGHRKADGAEARGLYYLGHQTVKLTAVDVLYCLFADASNACDAFEDWCSELGYDTDSRKALDTYLTCQATRKALQKLLGADYPAIEEETRDY